MLLTEKEIENHLRELILNVEEKDIHRAAKAIIETTGEWREIELGEYLGAQYSVQCKDICAIGRTYDEGCRIRAFVSKQKKCPH